MAVVAACVETGQCSVMQGKETESLADWMGALPDSLQKIPLHQLSVPGSHNSGSYEMSTELGLAPDADESLRSLVSLPIIGTLSQAIVHRYALCQNWPISKQLEAGIRFLDMRVAVHQPSGELHVVHSLFGPKISDCMEDVKQFLDDHQTEVVLIDFNHFYAMDLEHHLQLITYLLHIFGDLLCPFSPMAELSLHSLRDRNTRVVIFYHDSSALDFPQLWPKPAIASVWVNTMDADTCLATLGDCIRMRKPDQFLVCQAVLTPDRNTLVKNFNGSLQNVCAGKVNPRLLEWLSRNNTKEHSSVVYTADFIDQCDFVKNVIALCNNCCT